MYLNTQKSSLPRVVIHRNQMRRQGRGFLLDVSRVLNVYRWVVFLAFLASIFAADGAPSSSSSSSGVLPPGEGGKDEKAKQLNNALEKMKPSSATHTGDGLPTLPPYENPRTGERTHVLHPATILNGKHVGFSKKRILEEIGRKEMEKNQFFGQKLASEGFDSVSIFGAENAMKPIEFNDDEEEGNAKAKKRFTLLEFVTAAAKKKRATEGRDAVEDAAKTKEEISFLIDEEEEDDILGGRRVAVFNVDMSSDVGKYFENTGMLAKIKGLVESQKKSRKKIDAIRMSVNEMVQMMKKSLLDDQVSEQERATYDHMTFLTAGSGDESDKQFRNEDARDHRRNRGRKIASMEEIKKSNRDNNYFKSGQGRQSVRAEFYNSMESHVELAWLDFDGKEVKYADLAPGASTTLSTFTKHKWLAKNYIGDPICFFIVDDRYPTLKKQYFEISEDEHEEVTFVLEEEEEESSEAYIKRKELNRKLSLANNAQTGDELTQEEKEELLRVAREHIHQLLTNEKSEDVNIEVESVHVFESRQDIVDFFEKRSADKSTVSNKGEEEDPNVVWLSEEQFYELGMPDSAKIKPPLDVVDALVEEELIEEDAVRDVLRQKTGENRAREEEEKENEEGQDVKKEEL